MKTPQIAHIWFHGATEQKFTYQVLGAIFKTTFLFHIYVAACLGQARLTPSFCHSFSHFLKLISHISQRLLSAHYYSKDNFGIPSMNMVQMPSNIQHLITDNQKPGNRRLTLLSRILDWHKQCISDIEIDILTRTRKLINSTLGHATEMWVFVFWTKKSDIKTFRYLVVTNKPFDGKIAPLDE